MVACFTVSDALALGITLRRLRKKKGLTLHDLAQKTGLSFTTLHNLEVGKQLNPRLSTLRSICKALDTTLLHLFQEED